MAIKDFSTFVDENYKNEVKAVSKQLFEELLNEYSEDYEIDEGFLTKLRDAITGYLDKLKREFKKSDIYKPIEYAKKIKNNIQNVKTDIQEDIDLIKSKFKPRNKKEAETLATTVKNRYGYEEMEKKYQDEIDDYIDDVLAS